MIGNIMKKPFIPIDKIFIATCAGISFAWVLIASPTLANPNQTYSTLESDNLINPLSETGTDFNPLNLMHRANFGIINWNAQQENQELDEAAAVFKIKQKQLLQSQQGKTNSESTSEQKITPLIILPNAEN